MKMKAIKPTQSQRPTALKPRRNTLHCTTLPHYTPFVIPLQHIKTSHMFPNIASSQPVVVIMVEGRHDCDLWKENREELRLKPRMGTMKGHGGGRDGMT